MRGQPGLWDLDNRNQRSSAVGDQLEKLNAIVPWQVFEKPASETTATVRWLRPLVPSVLMFEIMVLLALYSLFDDQAEFVIQDRLSFMYYPASDVWPH